MIKRTFKNGVGEVWKDGNGVKVGIHAEDLGCTRFTVLVKKDDDSRAKTVYKNVDYEAAVRLMKLCFKEAGMTA